MSGAPETAPLLPANPNVTPKGAFTVQASHIPSDSTSIPFLLSCEVRPHEVSATSSHRRSLHDPKENVPRAYEARTMEGVAASIPLTIFSSSIHIHPHTPLGALILDALPPPHRHLI